MQQIREILVTGGGVLITDPRPEEHRAAMRLEGWPPVWALRPSFETPRKSAAPPATTAKPLREDEAYPRDGRSGGGQG